MIIDASADLYIPIVTIDPATGQAVNAQQLPRFRIYGSQGPVSDGNGIASLMESGNISAITTGTTTTITSNSHQLSTGTVITISGADANGTTNVDGNRNITVINANQFTFTGVTTSGTYSGTGASWHTTGLYRCLLDATIRAALQPGKTYFMMIQYRFGGNDYVNEVRFTVAN